MSEKEKETVRRTTIILDEEDRLAIEEIKQMYGTRTDTGAIRIALRLTANSPMATINSESNDNIMRKSYWKTEG